MTMTQDKKQYTSIRHIITYIGVFGGVEVLKNLAKLSRGKITAFFLGPAGMGILAIYQNILEVIQACSNIGLETASIKHLSEIDTEAEKERLFSMAQVIRTWSMAVAIVDVCICVVVALLMDGAFFKGSGHQLEILLLSPAAFLAPITAGECAILKGTHKLKRVALVELLGALGAVVGAFAIYGSMGVNGVVLALNLYVAIEATCHLCYSIPVIPYSIRLFCLDTWKRGIPLLKFGIPYAVTAILGALTTTTLYLIISTEEEVGLYKASFALMLYFVGIVLSSNSTDYFPRLTAVCHNNERKAETVNNQIHVCFTLSTPLVMVFLLAMPLIIVALYTEEFLAMRSLCVLAGLFILHRTASLPMEYVALAHGHSWLFLLLESLYNIMILTSAMLLYPLWGLTGMGIALSLTGVANTVILALINRFFYGIPLTRRNWLEITVGSLITIVVMLLCYEADTPWQLGLGIPIALLTGAYSFIVLRKGVANER